jgi:hypothetical protein
MIRRTSILLALVLILVGISVGAASADNTMLNLPPGIEDQAHPLLMVMMERMAEPDMSEMDKPMMMQDMQAMANQLPPGVFLQLLELMPQLEMADMMFLHGEMPGLMQQPPGQILLLVRNLAE